MSDSMHHVLARLRAAILPNSLERRGRKHGVVINPHDLEMLLQDFDRLDGKVRRQHSHAEGLRAQPVQQISGPDYKDLFEKRTRERDAVRARLDKYEKDGGVLPCGPVQKAGHMPEGWPTKEMCEAGLSLPAVDAVNDLPLLQAGWSMRAIQNLKLFRSMIAVAPQPGATE